MLIEHFLSGYRHVYLCAKFVESAIKLNHLLLVIFAIPIYSFALSTISIIPEFCVEPLCIYLLHKFYFSATVL